MNIAFIAIYLCCNMTKIIAWYLPQFHEFEENNRWWGKGFTEWTCLQQVQPTCPEHKIKYPHPDIGYYCLEDVAIRKKQAELAKSYGVYGFCYYHYWFGDKILMQKPLELMLSDGEPDLPFCLSWANEPWTRKLYSGDGELLQTNNYGKVDEWEAHFQYLYHFFSHKNYIQIDGKPLFLIYRISQIPNWQERFTYWQSRLKQVGFNGLYVVLTLGNFKDDYKPFLHYTDAVVEFFPNFLGKKEMILRKVGELYYYDMSFVYSTIIKYQQIHNVQFRGLLTGFDNHPRFPKQSNIFINGNPQLFGKALTQQLARAKDFLFINAWNEWGEGAILEPDMDNDYAYLEQVKNCLSRKIYV